MQKHFRKLMCVILIVHPILPPRYHDHWRFAVQRMAFLCSFQYYLKSGELATHETVATMLGGIHTERERGGGRERGGS